MQKEIQKFLTEHLGKTDFKLEPIKKGGSDRQFFRVTLPHGDSFVFMHYGDEVAENAHWIGISKFMVSLKMNVPRIIIQDVSRHFILIEDLGDTDLWSLRFEHGKNDVIIIFRRSRRFTACIPLIRNHFPKMCNSLKVTVQGSINGSTIIFWRILSGKSAK